MKKLLLFLLAAWGLTALSATAQAQGDDLGGGGQTATTAVPLGQYKFASIDKSHYNPFVDLAKLATEDPNGDNGTWSKHGIEGISAAGADLAAGTTLNNYYYHLDANSGPYTAKDISSDGSISLWMPDGSGAIDFTFMGKPVKTVAISALGGIYFYTDEFTTDEASETVYPTATAQAVGTTLADIMANYAAVLYPYNDNNLLTATRCEGDTVPCYVAYGVDHYGAFFMVQYQYSVEGQPWIFQIRCDSRGAVSLFVKGMNCALEQDGYKVALGLKRDTETLLLGGDTYGFETIADQTAGIELTKQSGDEPSISNRDYLAYPYGASAEISDMSYSSAKADITFNAETKAAVASNKILMLVSGSDNRSQPFGTDNDGKLINYKAGDVMLNNDIIVYHDVPTIGNDNKFSFNLAKLKPGRDYYLYAYLSYLDDDQNIQYANVAEPIFISSQFSTLTLTGPTKVTASAAQNNKVTLTINDTEDGKSYIVLKSMSGNITFEPSGNLAVNDTVKTKDNWGDIHAASIAGIANAAKTIELTLEPGEAQYVMVYKVMNAGTADAAYSTEYAMTTIAAPANKLPITHTFISTDNLYPQQRPTTVMPILPPGFGTTTVVSDEEPDLNAIKTAFAVATDEESDNLESFLASDYIFSYQEPLPAAPVWSNFTTPAFSGVTKQVRATFDAKFFSGEMNMWGTLWSARKPMAGDSVLIEYSLNGGNWQKAELFTGEDIPCDVEANNILPLEVFVNCTATDLVRFRYSYTTVPEMVGSGEYDDEGEEIMVPSLVRHIVTSVKFEAANCATPADLTLTEDGTRGKELEVKWTDMNTDHADAFLVSYQKYIAPVVDESGSSDGEGDWDDYIMTMTTDNESGAGSGESTTTETWSTIKVTSTQALLTRLEESTTYSIKVQAVCGADSSFYTPAIRLTTILDMPYVDSLNFILDMTTMTSYATMPNVKAYTGEPGSILTEQIVENLDGAPIESWCSLNSSQQTMNIENLYGLMVPTEKVDKAWLMTPAVYVAKTGDLEPKTFKFKVDPYTLVYSQTGDPTITHGADLENENLRLYVMASTNGKFTWNDTVASYSIDDMTFTADAQDARPGKEFSINMNNFEGAVQFAFYLHNPDANKSAMDLTKFIQVFDLSFNYDYSCRPIRNLAVTDIEATSVKLTWDGQGAVYGVAYGLKSAEETTYDTAYVVPTAGTNPSLTLEGLSYNTEYNAKVISYCSEDTTSASLFRTISFTTSRPKFKVLVSILPDSTAGVVTGAGTYFSDNSATLRASANEGFKFDGFYYGAEKITTGITNETVLKFTVTRDTTVTVKFVAIPKYNIGVSILPDTNAGSVKGAGKYYEGNEATLTATANTGYKFAGYFIGENKVSAEATYKFTVTRDTTIIAKFEEKVVEKYEVKVNVTPENAGTVTGAGTYEDGKEVTLTATANKGYKFVGYFEGETELSTTATYKFTASKNITITAKFVEEQANETQLRAEFRVSTENGNLLVRNLSGIKVKDVTVYNLAGRLLGQFAVSSHESLTLPVNAQRTIIFVRLNTEKGVAVYKVYLQ